MTHNVMIIKDGVCAFHRAYGEMTFTDIHLVGGFFHALLTFSSQLGEGVLDSIKYSTMYIYFKSLGGFTFILAVHQDLSIDQKTVEFFLNALAEKFHEEYPSALNWNGNQATFQDFAKTCDEILQKKPSRKGFPLLLKITFKPFLLGPALRILFIDPENPDYFYELSRRLEKYSETIGHKKLKSLLSEPSLIYLPKSQYLVYIYAFGAGKKRDDITHLLCFIIQEADWFMFYQLSSIIHKKSNEIIPRIIDYIQMYNKNPDSAEVVKYAPNVKEIVSNWADLNQYLGGVQASLIQEFYKSGLTVEALKEQETRSKLGALIEGLGPDFDKIVFALLIQKQIVFIGESKELVEQTLSALMTFYPHPSVVLWTERPSDYLLVGTHPNNVKNFDKNALIVDLTNNQITGGEKNQFCSELVEKTVQLAEVTSLEEAQVFFQGKIANLFALLKNLLDLIGTEEDIEQRNVKKLLEFHPPATLKLLARMSSSINMLLAKNIQEFLSVRKMVQFMGLSGTEQ